MSAPSPRGPACAPRRWTGLTVLALFGLLAACIGDVAAFQMESATFRIEATTGRTQRFTSRTFQQIYSEPPVVFVVTTESGGQGGLVRIRNVTTTGFEAVVTEQPGLEGRRSAMNVQYFAIEPGSHTLTVLDQVTGSRTVTLEAGRTSTDRIIACTAVPSACTGSYARQGFAAPFAGTPILLTELQTFVNGATGVPPAAPVPFISVAVSAVDGSGFDFALDRHEVTSGTLTPANAALEQVGYLAIDAGVTAADFVANGAARLLVELETILVPSSAAGAPLGFADGCTRNVNFSKTMSSPQVIGGKMTRRENDGGWLRRCQLSAKRARFYVDEDTQGDAETGKSLAEGIGVLVFSRAFFYDSTFGVGPDPSFRIEADSFTVTPGTPVTVTLRQFYPAAPAVFLLIDSANREPTAVRVTSVTTDAGSGTTQFVAEAIEPQGGAVPSTPGGTASTVRYVAVDKGVFRFPDGTPIEVGEASVSAVQQGFTGTDSFQVVNFQHSFATPPVVLAQIVGDANGPGVTAVPWLTLALATNGTTAGAFQVALERSEVNAGGAISQPERVFYLAVDPGIIGDFLDNDGVTVKAEAQRSRLRGNSSSGWDNICFNNAIAGIPFLNTYAAPPLVVAHEMTHFSGEGGWQRHCNVTATHVRIAEDEDQFRDRERSHTREDAGLLAFSQAFDADFAFFAWYAMEETTWNDGAAGQVVNSAQDGGYDGTPRDDVRTLLATPAFTAGNQSTCRYGDFDALADLGSGPDGIDIGAATLDLREALTVTAWIRWNGNPASGNARAVYVQNDTVASFDDYQFALRGSNNNRAVEFRLRTASGTTVAASGNVINANTWYHVTGTYDGANARLYVDGALRDTAAASGAFVAHSAARRLQLGRSSNSGSSFHAFRGNLDEVRLYRRALDATEIALVRNLTRPCADTFDHYALQHVGSSGGYGVTCEAENVTVSAHDDVHGSVVPSAGSSVDITAAPGGSWSLASGPGTFTDLGGGVGRYVFSGSESSFVLALRQVTPAVVGFTASDDSGRSAAPGEAANLEFRNTILDIAGPGGAAITGQIAGKPTSAAPDAQAMVLRALETNTLTGACEAALDGTHPVEFAWQCLDPGTCALAAPGAVNGASVVGNPSGSPLATTVSMPITFSAGSASLDLRYDDAGSVSLHARAASPATGANLEGGSQPFTVRPFALDVTVPGNPAAADATGAVFRRAGEPFTVSVRPVAWQAADDASPPDGIADGHEATDTDVARRASLADNAATPNYRGASAGAVPDDGALLSARLVRPASVAAHDPGLADGGADPLRVRPLGGATASTTTPYFDEVGVVELAAAQTGDYLGIGAAATAAIRGVSGAVGRFVPAWLEVASTRGFAFRDGLAVQPWSCDFTYLGQPFEYDQAPVIAIAARTLRGSPALNYARAASTADDFFRFDGTLTGRTYADVTTPAPAAPFAVDGIVAATVTAEDDYDDGIFELELHGERFRFDKAGTPDLPFAPVLELTVPADELVDRDGVCHGSSAVLCNTADADVRAPYLKSDVGDGAAELRFGRLVLSNAVGSELLPLPLPLTVESYVAAGTGGAFVPNDLDAPDAVLDTCTVLPPATALSLAGAGGAQSGDASVTLVGSGGVTRLVDPTTGAPPAAAVRFGAGRATLLFSAPQPAGNSGFVDVTALLGSSGLGWLQYDWDGDGDHDDDPVARASFGLFPGGRDLIYLREPWD